MNKHKVLPIIGVSPGNSFFTDQEIENILHTVFSKHLQAVVFIPDIPAIKTYLAIGYTEEKAKKKTKLKANNLRNKFNRIADRLGLPPKSITFTPWKEIQKNINYQKSIKHIQDFYDSNLQFKKDAQNTTLKVLENHDQDHPWSLDEINTAVKYLLCELAYLDAAPQILNVEKVSYVYNKHWPVYEKWIAGTYDKHQKLSQHFWLLESKKHTYSSITYSSVWDRINKTKIIRAGYFPCLNRFIEHENGKLSGLMYEVFMEIISQEGWTIDWVEKTGYGVISDRLNTGVYDIFCSTVWPTEERRSQLLFTKPLFQVLCTLWTKKQAEKITSIAVKHGDIHDAYVDQFYDKEVHKVYTPQFSDVLEPLRYLDQGIADATFAEPDHIVHYLAENPKAQFQAQKELQIPCDNGFVVAQNSHKLKECFDKHIQNMKKSGFIDSLIKKYKVDCL